MWVGIRQTLIVAQFKGLAGLNSGRALYSPRSGRGGCVCVCVCVNALCLFLGQNQMNEFMNVTLIRMT